MQVWLAMVQRRAVSCVHCHLSITRDDIVVEFNDTTIIHVRCWRVGESLFNAKRPHSPDEKVDRTIPTPTQPSVGRTSVAKDSNKATVRLSTPRTSRRSRAA